MGAPQKNITDADRVQYGVTLGVQWAGLLDGIASRPLARLVPQEAAVYALGEWGRVDGHQGSQPHALVLGHPQHVAIIAEELRFVMPQLAFHLDVPAMPMLAELHSARRVWGHLPAPPAPVGDPFAQEWAVYTQQRRANVMAGVVPKLVADLQTAVTLCKIAGLATPQLADMPQPVLDLYTARNVGLEWPPDVPFASDLHGMVGTALDQLAGGQPVAAVGLAVYARLFA